MINNQLTIKLNHSVRYFSDEGFTELLKLSNQCYEYIKSINIKFVEDEIHPSKFIILVDYI